MFINKPLVINVDIQLKPLGGYNEGVYSFKLEKTLQDGTQTELTKFVEAVSAKVIDELKKTTTVQISLLEVRNQKLKIQEELTKQLESKPEEEPSVI